MSLSSSPLATGDLLLLVDSKDRRYLLTLQQGKEFHSHAGFISHDSLIGMDGGFHIKSSGGMEYLAIRPTMADVVLKMPRSAQIIYPKDLGHLLIAADIGPQQKVLESGVGSGALSIALLRAGANVIGYELREDFAQRAIKNVTGFFGQNITEKYSVRIGNAYEGFDESGFDRMVLDLPEPWRVIDHVKSVLNTGGILASYTPSITQVSKLRGYLNSDKFVMVETTEILRRTWHVEGQAVRPDHRMVAHTGFITSARFIG
ncbi:MAG: tRNA (adenine-N1)-methyltransferase [Acidimicrobiales bacterium]|nr:tRNA (adenine-N1)-methyltransferase [Acidimicrobiales bacterium]MDP6299399.1 tRNA (adenine-N1)-methyltransferase [Acidimicrobiales bacterium]HJM27588.1 tRNA (adenine-N1)-methyltransferase [Acidimicrobiales bacterium]HJM96786.1 tRNA (adenine-N1)-methyltransferase [Acidimicrobiales bacterium]